MRGLSLFHRGFNGVYEGREASAQRLLRSSMGMYYPTHHGIYLYTTLGTPYSMLHCTAVHRRQCPASVSGNSALGSRVKKGLGESLRREINVIKC